MTHGITYLPKTDLIIALKDGEVSEMGTYDELMENDGAFSEFMQIYLNDKVKEIEDENFECKLMYKIKMKCIKQLCKIQISKPNINIY